MIVAETATTTGVSIAALSELTGIFLFVVAIIGGIVTYLIRRRGTTGTTDTSEAGTLWQQSQAMFTQITAERDKAITQVDKLMAAQSDQVIPILSAVLGSTQNLKEFFVAQSAMLSDIKVTLEKISDRTEMLAKRYGGQKT